MKRILVIDDDKEFGESHPEDDIRVVRTYEEGIRALEFGGQWDMLWLDYEINSNTGMDGCIGLAKE